jgi:hypothetical protein
MKMFTNPLGEDKFEKFNDMLDVVVNMTIKGGVRVVLMIYI